MSLEIRSIRAFLDPSHTGLLEKTRAFASVALSRRPPSQSDDEARADARVLLKLMGEAGIFDPIQAQDYRGCCLVREVLAYHSPLADAVFALQALGATPLLFGATSDQEARAHDEAIQHARTREQFGKPLSELPLIQDKIARMAIRLRASRLLVYEAAWEKDQGAERVTLESGMAKAFATENAQTIVDDAVQILGGRGVLKESVTDLLYRSVRALRIYEGATEVQHLLVAAQLLKPTS